MPCLHSHVFTVLHCSDTAPSRSFNIHFPKRMLCGKEKRRATNKDPMVFTPLLQPFRCPKSIKFPSHAIARVPAAARHLVIGAILLCSLWTAPDHVDTLRLLRVPSLTCRFSPQRSGHVAPGRGVVTKPREAQRARSKQLRDRGRMLTPQLPRTFGFGGQDGQA